MQKHYLHRIRRQLMPLGSLPLPTPQTLDLHHDPAHVWLLMSARARSVVPHKRCTCNKPCKNGCRHEGEASTYYSRAGGSQQTGCKPEQGF